MNYRHAFHAGNFADVVKHLVLMLVLEHLRAKPKPFSVIDTHAGIGVYDLSGQEAQKTGEWRGGVGRVLQAPVGAVPLAIARYIGLVRQFNNGDTMRFYPGSPAIARALLGDDDRLWLNELHPADAATLRAAMAADRRVQVSAADGYSVLTRLLPPTPRRGLLIMDPPFEQRDEFDRLAQASITAWQRWPQGAQMLWYPIKDRNDAWRLHDRLERAGLPALLEVEFMRDATPDTRALNGTGLVLVNTPWRLDAELATTLPQLLALLADPAPMAPQGSVKVSWIAPPV
jgi:23S rRNA (adenine2030-N6)-methyltransferase